MISCLKATKLENNCVT